MNKIIEDYTKRNDKNAGGLSLYGRERGGLFRSIIGRGKKVIDLGPITGL